MKLANVKRESNLYSELLGMTVWVKKQQRETFLAKERSKGEAHDSLRTTQNVILGEKANYFTLKPKQHNIYGRSEKGRVWLWKLSPFEMISIYYYGAPFKLD